LSEPLSIVILFVIAVTKKNFLLRYRMSFFLLWRICGSLKEADDLNEVISPFFFLCFSVSALKYFATEAGELLVTLVVVVCVAIGLSAAQNLVF